ncbi:hypothetical protein LTR35_000583 [Friedmanniomyces endolithicus]|nr:hypothetical protein LTR35_000583 [Friedmanniomyces endolithicus]
MVTFAVLLFAVLIGLFSSIVTGVDAVGLFHRLYKDPLLQLVVSPHDPPECSKPAPDDETWDIRYHLGGNNPWIPKVSGTVDGGIEPPLGCVVDQVHMLSRHAERYPTTLAGIRMLELYQHIQKANITLKGELAFANDWDFFMSDPSAQLENLVSTGPYAGTLEAFATGVKLRTRYEHLLDQALARNQTSFWASSSKRVVETAGYFGAGFFGLDWKQSASLHVIPETEDRGGDTLTADKTCFKYLHNADEYGRAYGYRKWNKWREVYLPAIVERLSKRNPEITFSQDEVYSMQELCGFELIAMGKSQWCDVFTRGEWEQFEYARDVLHFYRTGPGNPYSGTTGWLWLNATANILLERPAEAGPLFFSLYVPASLTAQHTHTLANSHFSASVHDGDIIPMLTALNLLPPQVPRLPTSDLLTNRSFRTSDLVPMGGRIMLERLACPAPQGCWDKAEYGYPHMRYCEPVGKEEYFVRVNVNDGIVALPGCDGGPGRSCPLGEFAERVTRRGKEVGEFREVCGLPRDAKGRIEFLHQ